MRVPLGENKPYGWEFGGRFETRRWLLGWVESWNGPDTGYWIPVGRGDRRSHGPRDGPRPGVRRPIVASCATRPGPVAGTAFPPTVMVTHASRLRLRDTPASGGLGRVVEPSHGGALKRDAISVVDQAVEDRVTEGRVADGVLIRLSYVANLDGDGS